MSKQNNIKYYYKNKWKEVCNNPIKRAYWSRQKDRRFPAYYKPPYTIDEFKDRMETHFTPDGYNWSNYGKWQVDHIIPLCQGGQDTIDNLQPLWKEDNQRKPKK